LCYDSKKRNTMPLKRFSISLEDEILTDLEKLVETHKFSNRSQAIRYLIKQHLVQDQWGGNEEVAGAIVLVYDHHKRNLQSQAT
jgi:CopG family nickel-responsive transcriptional regulator